MDPIELALDRDSRMEKLVKTTLTLPVMAIGAPESFGHHVTQHAKVFASNVEQSELYEGRGHSLALEAPERLAKYLLKFMQGK